MNPIRRVRTKTAAFQILGVGPFASASEIRAAWRKIAFTAHPDKKNGSYEQFARAKAAYDFLRSDEAGVDWSDLGRSSESPGESDVRVSAGTRPRVTTRYVDLAPKARAECTALLEKAACSASSYGSSDVVVLPGAQVRRGEARSADLIPASVGRHGRNLTYVVAAPLSPGINRVALPTAVLQNNRKVNPKIVAFLSGEAGPEEIEIPASICGSLFPGARSVRIRFGLDQETASH